MKDRRIKLIVLALLVVSLLLAAVAVASAATDSFSSQRARLTGAQEVPGPGDPDGWGRAVVRVYPKMQVVCYDLWVWNIDPATAAHIHVGKPGVAGPVVIPLTAPTGGSSSGCISGVDAGLAQAMADNPRQYYVNVHNAAYPAGAIRGILNSVTR